MMAYYTLDGDAVTREQIEQAVEQRRAVIVWQHGEWENIGSLLVCLDVEAADIEADRDTRGECYRMDEEVWCHRPASASVACRAAAGQLIQR